MSLKINIHEYLEFHNFYKIFRIDNMINIGIEKALSELIFPIDKDENYEIPMDDVMDLLCMEQAIKIFCQDRGTKYEIEGIKHKKFLYVVMIDKGNTLDLSDEDKINNIYLIFNRPPKEEIDKIIDNSKDDILVD